MISKESSGSGVTRFSPLSSLTTSAIFLSTITFIAVLLTFICRSDIIAIIGSYVFGICFCYLLLKYKNQIYRLIKILLSFYHNEKLVKKCTYSPLEGSCIVCNENNCTRHNSNFKVAEPWKNLLIHKQLDESIENFYETILEKFVSIWYSNLTRENTLLVELRFILRYASCSLLRRGLKINVANIIMDKLIPCAIKHYAMCKESQRLMATKKFDSLQSAALYGPLKYSLHPALISKKSELIYLRCVTEALMPFLLPGPEVKSKLFKFLIREIFSGWVLLPLTEVLANPYIINTLVILATNDEKMSELPIHPNFEVEFLEEFVKEDSHKRPRLLKMSVSDILKNNEYLYAFMQFMKSVEKIHLLQFCMDIDDFNKQMLQPDLSTNEQVALFNSAWNMYHKYFDCDSLTFISFDSENIKQLKDILDKGSENITKLQTSQALFQAYDHVYNLLDQEWVPKFFDSEDYYKTLCGPASSASYFKTANLKKNEKNQGKSNNPLSLLKEALKTQTVDGQIFDSTDSSIKIYNDIDLSDESIIDMDIPFSDILANYARLKERDLNKWRASIEKVRSTKDVSKGDGNFIFIINISKTEHHNPKIPAEWCVERTDSDFFTLRAKLVEFHGENLMSDAVLPSKKAKAAAEVRKKKYEVFLQNLLIKPFLKSSDLLHLFLTANEDFSKLADLARPESSIVPDIGSIYQSVSHKLSKEKGQHLDSFLSAFLLSTDVEYHQPIPDEIKSNVEKAEELTDIFGENKVTKNTDTNKNPFDEVFGNNFDIKEPLKIGSSNKQRDFPISGFSQSLLFLLTEVFNVRSSLVKITNTIIKHCGEKSLNNVFNVYLNKLLYKVLPPQRLGHLIHLGKELLFEDDDMSTKDTLNNRYLLAKSQLRESFPNLFTMLVGKNFISGVDELFELLQNPLLNKQLVYNLFDAALAELFPELLQSSK